MKKIKNILIPSDFSENSDNAVEFAFALFKEHEIKISFLNMYHIPVIAPEMPADIIFQSIEESKAASKENLSGLCNDLEKKYSNSSCSFIIKQEPLADAVKEAVKENNIDLVVMGTHGASGLKKFLFGTNTASVIKSSPVPVLAIPENAKFSKMKTILFATDYHDSDIEDINSLTEIAGQFDAEIAVVHIAEGNITDSEMLKWFESQVRKKTNYPKMLFFLLGKTEILPGLDFFIKENNVDLLAMSARSRSPFEKIFSPSETKKMVFHTGIPLLAFHIRDVGSDNF